MDNNPEIATWDEIKNLLERHFFEPKSSDKLLDELFKLSVKNGNIVEFYESILLLGSRILNKYATENHNAAEIAEKSNSVKRITLSHFIEKLDENKKTILLARNPLTLKDAYQILIDCNIDLEGKLKDKSDKGNAHSSFHKNNAYTNNKNKPFINHTHDNNFKPQNFPSNNRGQNKVEPMEVDPSSRTKFSRNYFVSPDDNDNEKESDEIIENFPLPASDEPYPISE